MKTRELPEEYKDIRLSDEYQERLALAVSEPGQKTLAYDFGGRPGNDPLTPMELKVLAECNKSLSPDWETKPTMWELGDEVTAAFGTLTYQGLIRWELINGWIVPFATEAGKNLLQN